MKGEEKQIDEDVSLQYLPVLANSVNVPSICRIPGRLNFLCICLEQLLCYHHFLRIHVYIVIITIILSLYSSAYACVHLRLSL